MGACRVTKVERNELVVRLHVEERRTLSEVGAMLGISRERVRQLVRAAGVSVEVTDAVKMERRARYMICEACGTKVRKLGRGRFCSQRCAGAGRRHTDDFLLQEMRRLALTLDRTPAMNDFGAPWPGHTNYYRHFGSLRRAQELAGLTPNTQGGYWKITTPLPRGFRKEWGHLMDGAA